MRRWQHYLWCVTSFILVTVTVFALACSIFIQLGGKLVAQRDASPAEFVDVKKEEEPK